LTLTQEENTAMFGDAADDIDIDTPELFHQCPCNGNTNGLCPCHCHKQEQQEDMADFIALNGQMDNEALADWDDCSIG